MMTVRRSCICSTRSKKSPLSYSIKLLPRQIYDNLYLHNKSFSIHCNTSQPYHCPTGLGDETIVSGIARHKDHFRSHSEFYANAANGTLPALSCEPAMLAEPWVASGSVVAMIVRTGLIPPSSSTDHPCHDVSKGERLLKDIYEAVRAGPGWSKTLLLVAYDDVRLSTNSLST